MELPAAGRQKKARREQFSRQTFRLHNCILVFSKGLEYAGSKACGPHKNYILTAAASTAKAGLKNENIMNDSKGRIIEKVLPLFIKNGFNGVSVADILKEIELSRGAFYYYFTSKEQCFEECVKHFIAAARADLTAPESVSLREYIDVSIKMSSVRVNRYSALDRIGFIHEAIRIVPNFLDYFSKMHAEEVRAWSAVIARAMETGEIKETIPAEDAARLFIYQCDGLVMNLSAKKGRAGLAGEIKKAWRNFYRLLKQ